MLMYTVLIFRRAIWGIFCLLVLTKVTSRKSSSSLISEKAAVMLAWKSFHRRQNCSVAIADERGKVERLRGRERRGYL